MSRGLRILVGVVAALLILGALVWHNQDELLLALIERVADRRMPVGPHQTIEWQTGPDPLGRTPGERPPNVVVILADDLGWNDLSVAGGGVAGGTVPTPSLEALANEGVRFTRGYSAHGTCAPSRAAIMTGRYATRFGFEFTPTPLGMTRILPRIANRMPGRLRRSVALDDEEGSLPYEAMGMPPAEITLAELLGEAGYHSVHIGKWHLGREGGMAPQGQGFEESLLMASGLYLPEDDPDVVNSKQDFDPIDRFLWRALKYAASYNGGAAFEPGGYLTDYYTDQAVRVIEANKDRPFFLYLAHWAPHTPLQALRADYEALDHIEDHRLRVYAAMIRSLDRSVGRVMDALRANGLEENTIVFFTSDNGGPGYIGLPEINRPYRGWKISFFEGGIRVPYYVKWPTRLPAGGTFPAPVHGFDIYATAAGAAGVALPADREIDGADLLPYARGERPGAPHRELFWRTGGYQVALVDGWKLQVDALSPGSPWLFDLSNDPTERTNLAAAEPDRVAALQRRLDAHNAGQAEPLWPSVMAFPINIDKTLLEPDAPDDEHIYWPN